jgi:hypothetical protein
VKEKREPDAVPRAFYSTEAELEQFRDRGFFWREQALGRNELVALREGADSAHQKILDAARSDTAAPIDQVDNQKYQQVLGAMVKWEWDEDLFAVRSLEPCAHLESSLDALIDDPRIWQPVTRLIDSDSLSLFSDKLNVKRPGGAPFPWHQDGPYWAFGAEQLEKIVSVAVYLDAATRENGCLWVIPGSHRHGVLKGLEDRGVLGALYTDIDSLEGEAVPLEAPEGSVVWFHRDLVHGSQVNRSASSRRVYVIAYQPSGFHCWRLNRKREIRPA